MNKKKYYAVAKGRKRGIYTEWSGPNGAQVQTVRFIGAIFKGFKTMEEAQAFMEQPIDGQIYKPRKQANKSTPVSPGSSQRTKDITIYTDGGCINNPGPGGYGAIICSGEETKELSGGYCLTTNNRMELMACIVALSAIEKPTSILLHSDSKYVVNGITKRWAEKWKSNGWIKSDRKPALNKDLWEQLLQLCGKHDVEFAWVKGHAGNEGNERCDELATEAAQRKDLPADIEYEQKDCPFPTRV